MNLEPGMNTSHMPQAGFESEIKEQAERRRTFAIISHPDAGKTTLTEKLLLYGGAIDEAGTVKSRRAQRHAASDWMELEKQRGISITSTILQFEYHKFCLNLLDTPGHEDFSEDTYRTLAAADNAVMLIDSAKGLEAQTRKLFEVCRMRTLPVFTFFNKLDRPCREPIELLDEIEQEFGLATYPVNWPVGTGDQFKGVIDRRSNRLMLFERSAGGRTKAVLSSYHLDEAEARALIPPHVYEHVREELDILDGAAHAFDRERILSGDLTPVYFGSAMNNFGVEPFLESFIELSSHPRAFTDTDGKLRRLDSDFTGFVFKLQANMDPRHRDRIAFVRICSGKFVKDMTVTNSRTRRSLQLSQPKKLFAQERQSIEVAYPGDIIGLSNPGAFHIGDTIYSGKRISFPDIPTFAPDLFAFLENCEPSKYKQFHKGIRALQEEGAIQILWMTDQETRYPLLAAVGALQFDVVQFRLQSEYGVKTRLRPLEVKNALWILNNWDEVIAARQRLNLSVALDRFEEPVLLFKSDWEASRLKESFPDIEFSNVAPRSLPGFSAATKSSRK